MIISLEGVTCSGKSTLAEALARKFRILPDKALCELIKRQEEERAVNFSPQSKLELEKTLSFLIAVEYTKSSIVKRVARPRDFCLVRDYVSIVAYGHAVAEILQVEIGIEPKIEKLKRGGLILSPDYRFVLEVDIPEIRRREKLRGREKTGYWESDSFILLKMKKREEYLSRIKEPAYILSSNESTDSQVQKVLRTTGGVGKG